jgi:serine/threonine protein phosphatase 1
MRTFAIGDIHGCSRAFDVLLDAFNLKPRDTIITLGDYINKGPDSKGVIERLINLYQRGQLIPLKGNHEQVMLQAYSNPNQASLWSSTIGETTLISYGKLGKPATLIDIPRHHLYFLTHSCLNFWETEDHLFVHANLEPHLSLVQQSGEWLFWQKFEQVQPHDSGKTIICGHTSQKNGLPVNLGYAICIDTWACGNGLLTGLEVNSGKIWQANQQGQVRTAWIDNFLGFNFSTQAS